MNQNLILDLSIRFSVKIIEYCELLESKKKYILARQLFKSGTSIGANINEAQSAESKSDFIHKMKISDKESEETKYWLQLCILSNQYPGCEELLKELMTIKRILGKIILSSKKKHI